MYLSIRLEILEDEPVFLFMEDVASMEIVTTENEIYPMYYLLRDEENRIIERLMEIDNKISRAKIIFLTENKFRELLANKTYENEHLEVEKTPLGNYIEDMEELEEFIEEYFNRGSQSLFLQKKLSLTLQRNQNEYKYRFSNN
jgi:hypothetical protein